MIPPENIRKTEVFRGVSEEISGMKWVNKTRNDYETVNNIKVVSIDSSKQLEVANKVNMSQTKLHAYRKHGCCLHTQGNFVCIFRYFDNVFILLDEDNDLEEEFTHLMNIFIFKFEKKNNQSGSK